MPFDLGQPKLIATGRTSFVNVRFAVTEFVFPKLKKGSDACKKAAKSLVFALTLVNIPRKATKRRPEDQSKLRQINDPTPHKQIQHEQAESRPNHRVIKTVGSVSAVHKLCHFHAKSTHNNLTSEQTN